MEKKNQILEDYNWKFERSGAIGNNVHNVKTVKEMLDNTGCGFCLAKFKQVTMHLGTGMTHSCHHPTPHKIDPNAVQENPHELFNTPTLKNARKEMLNGGKPSECDYCWRIEDAGEASDRHFKSLEPWAIHDHDNIVKYTGDEDLYPSYLEVSFSNVCNLKCTYCGPEFSSKWVEELKSKGTLKVLEGTKDEQWIQGWQDLDTLNYKHREFNPYIDAFWKWFPDALPHLRHYRITGGEPLMNKETYRSMDWIIENPNPDLEFSINSNLSVTDKLWDKFIDKLVLLKTGNNVKKVTLYTSVEGWGKRAEYARTGLDFNLLKERCEQVLKLGNVRVVIMAAYNIFSITSMEELLKWIKNLKTEYNPNNASVHWEEKSGFEWHNNAYFKRKEHNPDHNSIVGIDIPYLRNPSCLDVQYASLDLLEKYMMSSVNYMSNNIANDLWACHQGFETYEFEKFKRIVIHRIYHTENKKSVHDMTRDVLINRAKFYDMVNNLDKRRGTNFLETFPEMEEFYNLCKWCKEQVDSETSK